MRVLYRAPFNRISGYGNDGVDIARHLLKQGVDVRLWPAHLLPPIPEDMAMLLTKPIKDQDYDATLQFLPPFDIAVRQSMGQNRRQNGIPHKLAPLHYAWSMWEKDRLTRDDMKGHGLGKGPWRLLDVMYVTWPGCVQAFEHFDPRPEYRVLPCGIDGDLFPVAKRSTQGPTRFCMIGELHQRKDPFIAIDAFRELREEHGERFDAELHLKTSVVGLHPLIEEWSDGRIKIHVGIWPYEQLIEWMHDMTCYVGPSRGEGNLKPPMEFMATGGTVIVTNWSGPQNWLHPEFTYPLDYTLRPMNPNDPDSPREARASKQHLKELMWHVHTHRVEAAENGMHCADWIRGVASWQKLIRKLILDIEHDLAAL